MIIVGIVQLDRCANIVKIKQSVGRRYRRGSGWYEYKCMV